MLKEKDERMGRQFTTQRAIDIGETDGSGALPSFSEYDVR